MNPTAIEGVFEKNGKIFTENLEGCRGIRVYNEKLVLYNNREYRSWNPYRSKLAAVILKGYKKINITSKSQILYLGASTGTTVSHISDIAKNGIIYAVENSPFSVKKLLLLCSKRKNVVPLLSDARHFEKYSAIVSKVDILYQDISQRDQAEIFTSNIKRYLKKKGQAIIMVKARSINVSLKPKQVFEDIINKFIDYGFTIEKLINISQYEKDHAAIFISF